MQDRKLIVNNTYYVGYDGLSWRRWRNFCENQNENLKKIVIKDSENLKILVRIFCFQSFV